MPSNYTGNPATFSSQLSLLTDGDPSAAALWRVPEERLLDNDVYLKAQLELTSRALRRSATKPRLVSGMTLAAASNAAVVSRGRQHPAIVCNAGDSPWYVRDDATSESGGAAIPSITGSILGINGAYDPASDRVVVVGSGGNRVAYSDDGGQTWTAGANLGGTGLGCIWNPTFSRFIAMVTNAMLYSADASAAWTSVSTSTNGRGIAMLPNGTMYILTSSNDGTTRMSTDGGTTWVAGPTAPNAGDLLDRGGVAGAGLDYVFHAGVRFSGDGKVQISRIRPGESSWAVVGEIPELGGSAYDDACAIRQCPDTGLLAVLVGIGSTAHALAVSTDSGLTWTDPQVLRPSVYGLGSLAAVHGKVFLADSNAQFWLSDGIGWPE